MNTYPGLSKGSTFAERRAENEAAEAAAHGAGYVQTRYGERVPLSDLLYVGKAAMTGTQRVYGPDGPEDVPATRECEQYISRRDSMMRFRRWLPNGAIEHVQTYADPDPNDGKPGRTIRITGGPTTAMPGGQADSITFID